MTCDLTEMVNRIQSNPCNAAQTARNWDETKHVISRLAGNVLSLQSCFTEPIVDAVGVEPFQLTGDLPLGGTAPAVKLSYSGGAWVSGDAITVRDAWECGGKFWGFAGNMGFVWKVPGTSIYIVIQMQTKARIVRYTLDHTLTLNPVPGAASWTTATVNDWFNGCSPGATIAVYDPRRMFHLMHCKGCKGYADWNERSARYEIRDPQLMSKFYKMALDEFGTCVDPLNPGIIPEEAHGDIFEAYKQSYYSADPFDENDVAIANGITLKNPYRHMVPGNSYALAMVHQSTDAVEFVIIDVMKTLGATVPTSGVLGWGDCELTANTILSAVETCGELSEEGVPIPFVTADVPYEYEIIHVASPDSCKIVAHTHQYCMIDREADGADVDVAVMTEREVLTDWYLDYVAAVPPLTEYYAIKASTEKLWVPCYNSGSEVDIHHLLRRDIIDDFEPVQESSPESCEIVAHTKQAWLFDIPDPPVAGDDIDVLAMTKREVLIDLYTTSTDLMMDTEYHWILCYDPIPEQSVVGIDPCE